MVMIQHIAHNSQELSTYNIIIIIYILEYTNTYYVSVSE